MPDTSLPSIETFPVTDNSLPITLAANSCEVEDSVKCIQFHSNS